MTFDHIAPYDNAHKPRLYRLFEMIPGAAIWGTLLLAVVLSFTAPHFAMVLVVIFDLYWLVRVLYYVYNVVTAWLSLRRSLATDWPKILEEIPGWRDIWHVVLLPNSAEPFEIMDATFVSLAATNYHKDRVIVVLAGEEREGSPFLEKAARIQERYGALFKDLLITVHPDGVAGEIKGKGANAAWAGKKIQAYLDAQHISYDQVILSYFDIDTCVHANYFAALSATFLKNPNRLRSSYQPVALYNNNIWESSAITRVAAFGTTFWLFTELARPHRLFTFSSHAMPFRALVDVGFWQKDVVTDDTRIFLQCLLRYDGDYRVTPLYIPVSMDTAMTGGWFTSLVNLYKQQRRWAWGVEHLPY
ncbi:MAG: glycosyltransferase family 2 protein, partial [bacterium]|nr:glycosyltransferase family 2 protein [bacterium]